MKRSLIAIAALLASFCASAGELDGKSLICIGDKELELYRDDVVGFMFVDGNVSANGVRELELKYRILTFGESLADKSYELTRHEVTWFESSWVLNRKTLKITAGKQGKYQGRYQCQVFESFDDYHDKLLEIQLEKQRQLEDEMQDNKI